MLIESISTERGESTQGGGRGGGTLSQMHFLAQIDSRANKKNWLYNTIVFIFHNPRVTGCFGTWISCVWKHHIYI